MNIIVTCLRRSTDKRLNKKIAVDLDVDVGYYIILMNKAENEKKKNNRAHGAFIRPI